MEEMKEVESKLIYRSLVVTPVVTDKGQLLAFDIENLGNADLELLMLKIDMPRAATERNRTPVGIDSEVKSPAGVQHWWLACYSPRGVLLGQVPYLT